MTERANIWVPPHIVENPEIRQNFEDLSQFLGERAPDYSAAWTAQAAIAAETQQTLSLTRPSWVLLQVELTEGGSSLTFLINNKQVSAFAISPASASGATPAFLPLGPGDKWKWKLAAGKGNVSESHKIL